MPSATWAGVFGIERTMAPCLSPCVIDSILAPAIIDSTSASFPSLPHRSRKTNRSICGLTDRITISAFLAAFRLSPVVATPKRFSRSWMRSACGSLAVIAFDSTACEFSNPPIIAPAIAPPPMNAIDAPAQRVRRALVRHLCYFFHIALQGPASSPATVFSCSVILDSVIYQSANLPIYQCYVRICPVPSITHL